MRSAVGSGAAANNSSLCKSRPRSQTPIRAKKVVRTRLEVDADAFSGPGGCLALDLHDESLAGGQQNIEESLPAEMLGDLHLTTHEALVRPRDRQMFGPYPDGDHLSCDRGRAGVGQRQRKACLVANLDLAIRVGVSPPERKFMRGEPMKPATKRLAGWL